MQTDERVPAPALVGLGVIEAHALALDARVVTVSGDPDTPPPMSGVVVAQQPLGGTPVSPGDPITIWVEDTGGGGGGGGTSVPTEPVPVDPSGGKTLDPA
ncbi:PASTA domain-containing protein [Pseudonocardia sp.]|uniref:PASTA domain-containing protein n=1 Tax=Pseudonocardia sp. TaxID=60912 RepID=UPI003D0EBA64